jgi:uncharacterized membrane protein
MTPRVRSRLFLAATLLLGMILGALLVGALGQWLAGPPPGPAGFAGHMERMLRPRDDAQREAMRTIIAAADARNREILDETRDAMRQALVQMRAELEPLLDPEQLERLDRFIESSRGEPFPPPPGGPPPGPGRRPPRR